AGGPDGAPDGRRAGRPPWRASLRRPYATRGAEAHPYEQRVCAGAGTRVTSEYEQHARRRSAGVPRRDEALARERAALGPRPRLREHAAAVQGVPAAAADPAAARFHAVATSGARGNR